MIRVLLTAVLTLFTVSGFAADRLQLLTDPDLSPDGKSVLFAYRGDIWQAPTAGGAAKRLTAYASIDAEPHYSPDGKQIAFTSDRTGSKQIFLMDDNQSAPKQVTWHTEGYSLQGWYPDGEHLLVAATRDHFWKYAQRLMKVNSTKRSPDELLFNDTATQGQVSPDGSQVLFVREGERWWRKGYYGERAAQIWLYDIESKKFTQALKLNEDCFSPVWNSSGESFYYCTSHGAENGARNLWEYSLESKTSQQLTKFKDDLVTVPAVSADGKTIVFSHLFDLYRLEVGDNAKNAKPTRIDITVSQEDALADTHRRTLKTASDASFTKDGLEIAFIAGGDLWVMETELREPIQITKTSEFETDPVFIDDDNALVCVSWKDGEPDICKITRTDETKYWWQNTTFNVTRVTEDSAVESDLRLSPDGKHIAYIRERGDLWIRNLDDGTAQSLVESFSIDSCDFSPDGKWIVYAQTNDEFNSDIWIVPTDKSSEPVNISRHPDDESRPKWSPDGKVIAFTGRRSDDEIDIYYVWLTEEDNDTQSRDRKLKKALEAFKKARKKKPAPAKTPESKPTADAAEGANKPEKNADAPAKKPTEQPDEKSDVKSDKKTDKKSTEEKKPKLPEVKIDFTDIHRRLRRISIGNSSERLIGWSPDSKKLIFSATVKGASGTYSVEFPDKLTPTKISSDTGSLKSWLKTPTKMLWLKRGIPAAQSLTGSSTSYTFSAQQQISQSQRFRSGFDAAWRVMRDWWYDDNYGNHNWNEIRRKYADAAESAPDAASFSRVIHFMLGELNGSHLGFYPSALPGLKVENGEEWRPVTPHLGVRFDSNFKGPGLKVKDVIPNGPATDESSLIAVGEIILSIDGTDVDPAMDLTAVLNGRIDRDIQLRVKAKGKKGVERDVTLRPTSYAAIRSLLYGKWQDDNRTRLARKAKNIGYLHIQGMNWSSFLDFERELYDVGYGKDGLIIDVRDNGGGFTADHLLTALTQPRHAITVPRGGGPGYPQSRMVYATWSKPIVVLCNQNSYSNAEIFSHAIKNLGRGKLVGVRTAGGVISTGSTQVMDVGRLRLPFRGWFLNNGEDMEMNGADPDIVVWPKPGEIPNGKDRQLNRAVKVLQQSIKEWNAKEKPELIKATERKTAQKDMK